MTQRTMKFRGKRIDTGEWIIGDLLHDFWLQGDQFLKTAIRYKMNGEYYSFPIEVDPSTVGQATGLLDKSGREIWEGDLIDRTEGNYPSWIVSFENHGWRAISSIGSGLFLSPSQFIETEVTGTIHDTDHGK